MGALGFLQTLGQAAQNRIDGFATLGPSLPQHLLHTGRHIAVSENVELRSAHQLEIRMRLNQLGKAFGLVDTLLDQQFVAATSHDFQAGMHQQSHARPRAFQRMTAQILGAFADNVFGVMLNRRQRCGVLEHHHAGPHRRI